MRSPRPGAPELPEQRRRAAFAVPLALLVAGIAAVGALVGGALGPLPPGLGRAPTARQEPASQPPAPPPGPAPSPTDLAAVDTSSAGARSPIARLNPEGSVSRAWLLAEGPEPLSGDGRRYVTFTFDDGPFVETTPAVLRVLEQRRIRATFFVVGQYLEGTSVHAERTRAVLRDIARAGHLIGNHTQDHRLLTGVARGEAVAQIDDGSAAIERATGKRPFLFRPPFGELDAFTSEVVRARGLELVLWSVEAADMKREDPEAMAQSLAKQLEYNGGGVVLLHDIRPTTLPTLKRLLSLVYLKRWLPMRPARPGFQIVDLPTYLALTEASPRPYANREALENARRDASRLRHPTSRAPARASRPETGSTRR